ncbi:MarR family winged helix-turn-helix transcriptional regulator [Pseudomonas citronellolis]|uniref:MarR family winged helix-turn-helix transcriptional regulator n=1 Tax=Pseudomonas citronellolis TaxID=53408 RepID=UPI0018D93EBF|nr:MarR family transcriptional regulator [Pseudomonas citronellolis]MBH3433870.1 MarR family transcriptional regulator [Pseudomonas citronellolis]
MSRKSTASRIIGGDDDQGNSSPVAGSPLDNYVGYALRRAQLIAFQHLVDELARFDLRPAQFTALAIIDSNPGLMQADLARALNVEPPQLVPLLNKLETRALAVRVRCKADKRSYGLFLSKAGETLLKQLKEVALKSDQAATARLSEAEREQLLALLQKVHSPD